MSKHAVRTTDDTIYNAIGVALALSGLALAGATGMNQDASVGRVIIGCATPLFGLPFILSGKGGWDGWRNRACMTLGFAALVVGCIIETFALSF